jgi:polyisoprenyl-phosphate glycosyltransferase
MTRRPLISVVVPVYNEEANLGPLYERLGAVAADLEDRYDFEFLFTDNHSTDGTFDVLTDLAAGDERIRVLRFSRNFGFQRSILTGYLNARGDAAVQIDADLQDPPELIADFLAQWEKGYDVVYGVRRSRKEAAWLNLSRRIFYRIIDALSDDSLPHNAGDFRLVSRRVLDALAEVDDYHPYLRGLIASFGFEQMGIPYDRAAREHGESKFPLRKLVSLAVDGILLHSVVPLRIATWIGFVMSFLMLIGIGVYTYGRLVLDQEWPAGFATTTVLIMTGIILNALFLGIIGEYLGRIYQQVKRRPLTIIERRVGPDDDTDPRHLLPPPPASPGDG